MQKKKLIAALALSFCLFNGTCLAEQPKAAEYRAILNSGTFFIEYKDNFTTRILVAKNGERLERTNYKPPGWTTFLNPLGALFGGGTPKNPEVMYKDGNFYQFKNEKEATILSEEHLTDENLDPRQGWNGIGQKLALPAEFTIFAADPAYRPNSAALSAPIFRESFKKTVDDKNYICDRYVCNISHADGSTEAEFIYDALYDAKGNLVMITSAVLADGIEYPNNKLVIKKILAEVPKGTFEVSKKTKIYAAGNGDMNDLLEQPVQVATMEGIE